MTEIEFSVEQIKNETKDIKWDSHQSISAFYTKYIDFFEKLDNAIDDESKMFFIDIKLHYVDVLIGKQRYSVSKPVLTDVNILLEKLKEHNEYDDLYERYLMLLGIVEGRLEKYEISLQIFKVLREIDPDNGSYKKWYVHNKSNLYSKKILILSYIGLGIIMIDVFADLLFDYEMNGVIAFLGIVLLFSGFVVSFVVSFVRKYYTKIKEKI